MKYGVEGNALLLLGMEGSVRRLALLEDDDTVCTTKWWRT
jgi:hypothetical protein